MRAGAHHVHLPAHEPRPARHRGGGHASNARREPVRKDVYDRSIGRKKTQPIWERSFGSTVRQSAGEVRGGNDRGAAGSRARKHGGAMFSDLHANFIINIDGSAGCGRRGSADRPRPHRGAESRYGVELKTEVVVIGNR